MFVGFGVSLLVSISELLALVFCIWLPLGYLAFGLLVLAFDLLDMVWVCCVGSGVLVLFSGFGFMVDFGIAFGFDFKFDSGFDFSFWFRCLISKLFSDLMSAFDFGL